jgi:hypothetical protein
MMHLTQYDENRTYVQCQLIELAVKMNAKLDITDKVNLGDSFTVKNEAASFIFTCYELDDRSDCCANYYKLVKIIKHLDIEVGAQVVIGCHFQDSFRQGDIATLTKNDGDSGWWAKFPTGVWNVGFGQDFFVIKAAKQQRKSVSEDSNTPVPVGKLTPFQSSTEKLFVAVHRVGKRRKMIDEIGNVFVKANGRYWKFPEQVSY